MHFAESGSKALDIVREQGPFAAIISDMRMPMMTGLELLQSIAEISPDTTRIMLTGNADQKTATDAVNHGKVFRFLTKPCETTELVEVMTEACKQYDLACKERVLMEQTLSGVVKLLVEVLNGSYPALFARSAGLHQLVKRYGSKLGGRPWMMEMAAMLSEIGWLALPYDLVERAMLDDELSASEQSLVDGVQASASRMLSSIPRLADLAAVIAPPEGHVSKDAQVFALLRQTAELMRVDKCSLRTASGAGKYQGIDPEMISKFRSMLGSDADVVPDDVPTGGRDVEVMAAHNLRSGDRMLEDLLFESGELAIAKDVIVTAFMAAKIGNLGELRPMRLPVMVKRGERRPKNYRMANPAA
jgi:CheY-like chemotaxis protein